MFIIVIGFNLVLSLLCLGAAWQVWKLRRQIAKVAETLRKVEQNTDKGLRNTPRAIFKGQRGAQLARERYQQLEPQLQRIQQVVGLVRLGQTVWQRSRPRPAVGLQRGRNSKKIR